ncbi:MAG TPA: M20/M25/M40 family metallo-hydrolase [Trebonia sp.]|nr:M20/M25/M40 family metallo-hydrolase [Trebonia sp.]
MSELDVVALLAQIADVGRDARRGGYTRHVFDEHELWLRQWFTGQATQLGLSVQPDGNGNLWAWWGEPGPGAVLTGSHLDSVPGGGGYDGPLGVASALAAVSSLAAAGLVPSRPLAVVAFAEEEGARFGRACLGSRLAAGQADPDAVRALRDQAGITFVAAARHAGLDPNDLGPVSWATEAACFVELHVEQGRALADLGQPLAIGTSVLAHGRWKAEFTGEGNHAGTTRMAGRRDPVVAAARLILAARDLGLAADQQPSAPPVPDSDNSKRPPAGPVPPDAAADTDWPDAGSLETASSATVSMKAVRRDATPRGAAQAGAAQAGAVPASAVPAEAAQADAVPAEAVPVGRMTVGRTEFTPGGTNVIASRAAVWLDIRAGRDAALGALAAEAAEAARLAADAEGCTVAVTEESLSPLVEFDAGLRQRIAGLLPGAPMLPTGAGHDAGILAALIPTAMLFVRNPTGVSHAPGEGASDEDCRAGARALAAVLRDLLSAPAPR